MKIVYAKYQFSAALPNGLIVTVKPHEPWDADSDFVKAHEGNFTETPLRVKSDSGGWVETATAAPGEKRKSGRGK